MVLQCSVFLQEQPEIEWRGAIERESVLCLVFSAATLWRETDVGVEMSY